MKSVIAIALVALLALPAFAGEGVKPAPGKEALARPVVEVHLDAGGIVRVLPADMAGKDVQEAEILEIKPSGMKAALEAVLKACASAPRKIVELPAKPGDDTPKPKLPIRLMLRWNPTINKCKFYVGQVLCNYDEQGLLRAGSKIKSIIGSGAADTVEIDAGPDVPLKMILQAIAVVRESGATVEKTLFTGKVDPLGEESGVILEGLDRKKLWSDNDKKRIFPDVKLLIRIAPETQWRHVQFLLQECVFYGVIVVSLSSKHGEKIEISFPPDRAVFDQQADAETKEKD